MIVLLSIVLYLLVGSLLVYVILLLISKGYIDRDLVNLLSLLYLFWIVIIPLFIILLPFILVTNLFNNYKHG
nr:MAG TPA: hypothetical protein [Crassvirales sp.]